MKSQTLIAVWLATACGGGPRSSTRPATLATPPEPEIRLQPTVAGQVFYRSTAACAQGPFELSLPIGAAPHGEEVELLVKTPRAISLHAVVLAGGEQLAAAEGTLDANGWSPAAPQNARCVADARERLALGRRGGGSGGGGGTMATPPARGEAVPPASSVAAQLEAVTTVVVGAVSVVHLRIPDHVRATGNVRVRFWSIQPNDLEGAVFGISHVVWRPNVSDERYAAYLVELAARAEADRASEQHRIEVLRQREQAQARELATRQEALRRTREARTARVHVTVDLEAERRAALEQRQRFEAEQRAARQRQLAVEAARRAAVEVERQRGLAIERRRQFCATHPADRGCWGPGGMKIHVELEQRRAEAGVYCQAHREDARCWTDAERAELVRIDRQRLAEALRPKLPSGPPPSPLAEVVPPRLSVHAEWRPGYWLWVDERGEPAGGGKAEATWVWLAGMWRVPERDLVADQTTTAPVAPPPIRAEAPPAPPVRSAVWTAGFWQWDGTGWIWVAGSWQLRPTATVTWRATAWQPRGAIHVLVPGAWVRNGAGR